MLEKLEKSREDAALGMYKETADISHDMRVKYEL